MLTVSIYPAEVGISKIPIFPLTRKMSRFDLSANISHSIGKNNPDS